MDYKATIQEVFQAVGDLQDHGTLPTYIPELAKVDAAKFGVYISTSGDQHFGIGDYQQKFSIQSIAKVISLCLAYSILGEKIWERVGVEPSGTAFNSLIQLEVEKGIPRNPFINAGALVICDILISHLDNPKAEFLAYCKRLYKNTEIKYSPVIVESEKSVGFRNVALCNLIKDFGNLENDPNDVLDFYYHLCSIEMNCKELAELFFFLANDGVVLSNGDKILTKSQAKRINALMQSCGFYDESGEFTFKVGLPGKSGVGGGIIAIHPKEYAIVTWSPRLNTKGNSYKGMKFLEAFTTKTERSIF